MSGIALQQNPYDRLLALPDNLVGEIINGELYTQPRLAGPYAVACSSLGMEIGMPYQKGRGAEVHFVRDTEVLVPDIAGCRKERLPQIPGDQRFEVQKMPVYARYGVPYLWLVDPLAKTLETYELQGELWLVSGMFKDDEKISAPPFADIVLALSELWVGA